MRGSWGYHGALILAGACTATPAAAAGWEAWSSVSVGVRSDDVQSQTIYECNGTDFSYCTPVFGSGVVATVFNSSTLTNANQFATVATHANPNYNSGYGSQESAAWAYSNLLTGKVGVQDRVNLISGYSGGENEYASATAGLHDTVHFISTDGLPTTFQVKFHVDGVLEGQTQSVGYGFSLSGYNTGLSGNAYYSDPNPPSYVSESEATARTYLYGNFTQLGPRDFIGNVAFDPVHPDYDLYISLSSHGYANSYADFSHTGSISFVLPSNLSFTSDSGVFLTKAGVPGVPEPSTWAMMILGFGAVGYAMRLGKLRQHRAIA